MDYTKDSSKSQYDFNNIQRLLIAQIDKSRRENPQSFSKPIYVLSAINDDDEGQLEQQLQKEREDHSGERILLIPYCLENSLWTGVLIEFLANNKILRATHMNPVTGSTNIPNELQRQLTTVYPSTVIESKVRYQNNDPRLSSALTIKNLSTASENSQCSSFASTESQSTNNAAFNESDIDKYSTTSEPMTSRTNTQTSTSDVKAGNQDMLAEKRQDLSRGLEKYKIRSIDAIPQKIQKTEERIKEYEEDEREEDVEKEKNILKQLQRLENLAKELATPISGCSSDNAQETLRQMSEELSTGLAKLKIRDVDSLPQKIKKAEDRIKDYEEDERTDDVEKESAILRELQRLHSLNSEIVWMNESSSASLNNAQSKIAQLREQLNHRLAKLKLRDESVLLQKIQKTQNRIKDFEDDERTEDVKKEQGILNELQQVKKLVNEIASLSQERPQAVDISESKVCQMREELERGLSNLKLRSIDVVPEKIQRTETRIKEYEEDGRTDEAENEKAFLKELQRLQCLANQISTPGQETSQPQDSIESKIREMKDELSIGLAKLKIKDVEILVQKIERTEIRIKEYEEDERTDDAEKEKALLKELQRLHSLANEIAKLQSDPSPCCPLMDEPITPQSDVNSTVTLDDARKKRLYINDLEADVQTMPPCAMETLSKLLVHFEKKLLGDQTVSEDQESLRLSLQMLEDQVKREELSSDDVKAALHNLGTHITNGDDSFTVRYLNDLLKRFRLLNVAEIERLVGKATEAAELIQNKDIVLLIGTTGSGKSTTIQFLAGATMKEVKVEVSPGNFLEHVTAIGRNANVDLNNVISSPFQKSETRYIAPVNVELRNIFGERESGMLTLCDAPGFGDTAGPEVDIANSVGVMEALKRTKSVKILALISFKSLGDRGQGIQKLAHILINMIHGVENKLDAIFYGFTKFPASTSVHALLLDIKRSKVDEDPNLKSNTTFVSVLMDMIEKTEEDTMKIDPIKDHPKRLARMLKNLRDIKNPQEVFRFSMSEETRAAISDHVQRDKFSIICAIKHKDYKLIHYYLNDLQILIDLLKESFIRDMYDECVRFVSESVSNYSTEMQEKFNRVLASQDGLQNKDILDYRTAISYLENAQVLKEHLQATLIAPTSMLQNIINQLNDRSRILAEEELRSPLVIVYLKNLSELKSSFSELRECYHSTCKTFQTRFDELIEYARKAIPTHDFKQIADVLLNVYQSACVLQDHIGGHGQEAYGDVVKYLLRNLNKHSDETEPLLAKMRLSQEDTEKVKSCVDMLRSAKDTAALQERVSLYFETLTKKAECGEKYESLGKNVKDLNSIFDEFIEKVLKHFEDINIRIEELFKKSEGHALENIKALVSAMDALRTIPEIELKTARGYYRIAEHIRGYTEQLKADVEKLIIAIDQQTGIMNFKHLARSLARLKSAEWINEISPEKCDILMQRITEEILEYAFQLQNSLMRLDLSLKCPDNISAAVEIVDKIESMRDLEQSVSKLEECRHAIIDLFVKQIQAVFDHIQNTFNLEDKEAYQIKQKLKELEEIKREYGNLYPACSFLRDRGYKDIQMLANETEKVKARQKVAHEAEKAAKHEKETKVNALNAIIREYMNITFAPTSITNAVSNMVETIHSDGTAQANAYLTKLGYTHIDSVHDEIAKIEKNHRDEIERLQDQTTTFDISLQNLETIKTEHHELLLIRQSSSEEVTFLQEKGFGSYELLDEAIQEKTKVINDKGKNKQTYSFTNHLEVDTAENAFLYLMECQKVSQDAVRKNALDAHERLRKYIREYGIFLTQEIDRAFIHTRTVESEGGPFMHSQDLKMRLTELSSFTRYSHVSQCMNVAEVIGRLHREFDDFHRSLGAKMEEYKVECKLRELRDQLTIAQALSCIDHFRPSQSANNGFGVLYHKYQGEITTECRAAYKIVLDYISKGEYANADMAISDIEENRLNPRYKAQIAHDLQCTLNKLMKDTKSAANCLMGKIEREDKRNQITQIKDNIDKIRTACSKRNIMDILDTLTRENLLKFDNAISEILAEIILRGMDSIEAFMEANSFSEAQQGMETISEVERELAGYYMPEGVKTKGDDVRRRLDDIVHEVLNKKEFFNINNFAINPPKNVLESLQSVAGYGSARFKTAHASMLARIRQTFNKEIEDVREAYQDERVDRIHKLKYALNYIPKDLAEQVKQQIEELENYISKEKEHLERDVKHLMSYECNSEYDIKKIGHLAKQCMKKNLPDLFRSLNDKCIHTLMGYQQNIDEALKNDNIPAAIDVVRNLVKYEEYVGAFIPEIKGIVHAIRTAFIAKFSGYCNTLANISSTKEVMLVERAFANILVFLEYSKTSEKRVEACFPIETKRKVDTAFECVAQYFIENSDYFQLALKNRNDEELRRTTLESKKWQSFSEKIRQCSLDHPLVHNLLNQMKKVMRHDEIISHLKQLIESLKTSLNVELFTEEKHQYETKRDNSYSDLANAFKKLSAINNKFKDILPSPIGIEAVEKEIKVKVEKMRNQLNNRASKAELTAIEADEFRMYYNHLVSFNEHFQFLNLNVDQMLREAENIILAKVVQWRRTIYKSLSDPVAVSSALVKIKFIAENLPMFDAKINGIIDEILKHYKEKEKSIGIMSLSVELDKTDVGARLISEHSILSGEDLRLRRQKMHYQDNLDYALDNLTGIDLAKDALRTRYSAFRKKYDELLASNLKSLQSTDDKEPNLEVLVAQTKSLASSVTVKADSITWTRSFRDDLPELLAHIFAIWTLKNTQHYNAMRGVDKADVYLLMPHVGQIITIFRLLGLGYRKPKEILGFKIPFTEKNTEDSMNNLAEVGTGEGKSVVMAVTACVFALTGVDVNCSCFSDILSTRDKNNFASLFRALGIEDRIQYGTFNKLCEQLLNEQCNVRQKVRDMILTNKTALPKIDKSTQIRPKALLIDEVDVFLSDKYYGGIYIPSVFLKDDAIKALLDSIWQNKHFKSLKSVQALPAYQTCATKFSNWMMLFDEAIKDMIAALQSYQSSTYLVKNDRIVYVDGESIVDNVVLGYDTVWAYYHENSKGAISATSLQENVGILINCGRFSYAEMPHDFAYIGGVTGTLKTLAPVETKILEKVYSIIQKTFIPSVFGSSNRTYNEYNDVRVVSETEYFMEICNEIRMMCDAKRAILVFFKSQEDLEAFDKSSQLAEMKQTVQIITEKVAVKEKDLYIKRAATISVVTLLTRTFGRGTDFICRQQQLLVNGGIHVVQTFFSEELSEEYQIMGRGARQGDRGSYRMILLDKNLEWVLGSSWKEEIPKIKGTALYKSLHEKRRTIYDSKCGAKELGIKQCKSDHEASKKFMSALISADMGAVKEFLMKQNKGANLVTASSRTVLLMDATGSMSSLLSATKDTICTMFERASRILAEKGLPNDAFQMQFAVYRNYNSDANKILQVSSWNTKASNLQAFMKTIGPEGGWGNEAVEIGLWHVVNEGETEESISQVILIGDAPANSENEVTGKRARRGEKYWKKTQFEKPTFYATEVKKLKDKNIPVHTFYLTRNAQSNFEEIARETSGRSEFLDINSLQGAELLTNFVTEEILRKSADDQGDAIVALYRKMYVTHTS